MTTTVLDQMKQGARAMWAAGDYPAIAQRQLWPVGERVVRRAAVAPGEDVLDVACGTGNAALRAAQAGGRVTGVDLTPELFEAGRVLAAEAGVEIEFVEGDAEALPVPDGAFDVVVSVMGCMFAPRHRVTAAELARALRPGGRLCVTAWTPDGEIGKLFRVMGAYMPPAPPFAEPPGLWGTEDHVRDLFAGTGVELGFAYETVAFDDLGTIDEEIAYTAAKFGPMIMARRLLEPQGRWEALLGDLRRVLETRGPDAEYLVISGVKSQVQR
jgi:SAM-dependent methyltransferase